MQTTWGRYTLTRLCSALLVWTFDSREPAVVTKKNVIVLTVGLAGSSVLTALLSRAGFWVGEETKGKPDYNTWENARLVDLNRRLLREVGFTDDWKMVFRPDYMDRILAGAQKLDPSPYRAFVDDCNQHAPWIWKDPRLWLTIRYWQQFLSLEDLFFLVIRRDPVQAWISMTIRRQIQSFEYAKNYDNSVHSTITDFLQQTGSPYLDLVYEDLLTKPDKTIDTINRSLGTGLSVDDLRSVFRGKLFRRQHGFSSFLRAAAIYARNYRDRYR